MADVVGKDRPSDDDPRRAGDRAEQIGEAFHYLDRSLGMDRTAMDDAWRFPHPIGFFATPSEVRGLDDRILVVCSDSQRRDFERFLDGEPLESSGSFRRLNETKLLEALREAGALGPDQTYIDSTLRDRIVFVQNITKFWEAALGVGELHNINPAQRTLPGTIITSRQAYYREMVQSVEGVLEMIEARLKKEEDIDTKLPLSALDYPERFNCGPQLERICGKFGIRLCDPFDGSNYLEKKTNPLNLKLEPPEPPAA